MVDVAEIQADFDDAFDNDLSGVGFAIKYQSPLTGYDTAAGGPAANTNPVIIGKAFLTERSRDEADSESVKVSKLNAVIMRSWLSVEPIVDGVIEVDTGPYAGKWTIGSEPASTVVHWELLLIQ